MANRIKGLTVEIDALFTAGCTWRSLADSNIKFKMKLNSN